jgi:hypothetical protein
MYSSLRSNPSPLTALPRIVALNHVALRGPAMPSAFSIRAILSGLAPAAYASNTRLTTAAC